jgi:hypothetical protein
MPNFAQIDPQSLHLPPSRASGADPAKLHRQIAKHRDAIIGMPAIWVYRGKDAALMIVDGVTRATRAAKLRPGVLVQIEIIGELPTNCGHLPTVGERLP